MTFLLSFHPVVRNLDVMAGAQAASLNREEEATAGKGERSLDPCQLCESTHQLGNVPSFFLCVSE